MKVKKHEALVCVSEERCCSTWNVTLHTPQWCSINLIYQAPMNEFLPRKRDCTVISTLFFSLDHFQASIEKNIKIHFHKHLKKNNEKDSNSWWWYASYFSSLEKYSKNIQNRYFWSPTIHAILFYHRYYIEFQWDEMNKTEKCCQHPHFAVKHFS